MFEGKTVDNLTMRVYLETIQAIVGNNGLKSILNYGQLQKYIDSYPPENGDLEIPLEDLHRLYVSLLDLFGNKGTHGLQLRVGREIVKNGIGKLPGMAKAIQASTRLIPEHKRMQFVLKRFTEEFGKRFRLEQGTRGTTLREEEDCFYIIQEGCYMSEGVQSEEPVCSIYVGMLLGIVEWITGREHAVEEIECRAMGYPADVFRIAKAPRKKDQ